MADEAPKEDPRFVEGILVKHAAATLRSLLQLWQTGQDAKAKAAASGKAEVEVRDPIDLLYDAMAQVYLMGCDHKAAQNFPRVDRSSPWHTGIVHTRPSFLHPAAAPKPQNYAELFEPFPSATRMGTPVPTLMFGPPKPAREIKLQNLLTTTSLPSKEGS